MYAFRLNTSIFATIRTCLRAIVPDVQGRDLVLSVEQVPRLMVVSLLQSVGMHVVGSSGLFHACWIEFQNREVCPMLYCSDSDFMIHKKCEDDRS